MATYPAGNPGRFPIDPETAVGQFRARAGDSNSVPYEPVEPGYQNYTLWSDAEIEAYLAANPGNSSRAIGEAYLALASGAAMQSKTVKDYDLQIDLTKRAADLRAIASMWFDRADEADDQNGTGDIFDVFDTGYPEFIPEGSVPIYGRAYRWERL